MNHLNKTVVNLQQAEEDENALKIQKKPRREGNQLFGTEHAKLHKKIIENCERRQPPFRFSELPLYQLHYKKL